MNGQKSMTTPVYPHFGGITVDDQLIYVNSRILGKKINTSFMADKILM